MPLAALALAIAMLAPGDASACTDSGMPPSEPTQPFDAGPGCTAVLMCGTYYPVCVPDGGQDAGPVMCSEWADTAGEGLDAPQHYLCSRDEDCPGNRTPAMVCGAAGYCECPIELATPSSCSVAPGASSSAWALAILALAILVARRL